MNRRLGPIRITTVRWMNGKRPFDGVTGVVVRPWYFRVRRLYVDQGFDSEVRDRRRVLRIENAIGQVRIQFGGTST